MGDRDKSLGGHAGLEFEFEGLVAVEPEPYTHAHAHPDIQALINPNDTLFQWDELTDDYAFFHILNQSNTSQP